MIRENENCYQKLDRKNILRYSETNRKESEEVTMSAIDIFLILLIAGGVFLVIRKMLKDKKEGKTCCGCGSSCGGSCHCGMEGKEKEKIQ